MTRARLATLALFGLLAGHPLPHAAAAGDPCAAAWDDADGDSTYGLVYPVPLADADLDINHVTVRATATSVVVTVAVAHLSATGPTYGTGHGVGVDLTRYGREMSFLARKDATYGDRTYATGDTAARTTPVRLALDVRTNTYTLTVSRADIARLAGTRTTGGDLTGIGVFTLRSDHLGHAGDMTGSSSVGTSADDAVTGDGARLSLGACDKRLRRR